MDNGSAACEGFEAAFVADGGHDGDESDDAGNECVVECGNGVRAAGPKTGGAPNTDFGGGVNEDSDDEDNDADDDDDEIDIDEGEDVDKDDDDENVDEVKDVDTLGSAWTAVSISSAIASARKKIGIDDDNISGATIVADEDGAIVMPLAALVDIATDRSSEATEAVDD